MEQTDIICGVTSAGILCRATDRELKPPVTSSESLAAQDVHPESQLKMSHTSNQDNGRLLVTSLLMWGEHKICLFLLNWHLVSCHPGARMVILACKYLLMHLSHVT